jgi:hypothetical protein
MFNPDINPVVPGFTTDAERSSLEVSMSLRAVEPCDCNGVMFHNVLVHSGECCRFERNTAAKLRATLPAPTRREVWS